MTPERIAEINRIACNLDRENPAYGALNEALDALEAAQQEIADLKRGGVVVPEIPTWEDGENKLRRGETLTALEKFVMDHDWNKMDASFRDGLEAVFAELRANHRTIPADRELMRLVDELIRWHGLRPLDKRPDHAAALVGAIKAIRAQPTQEPTT